MNCEHFSVSVFNSIFELGLAFYECIITIFYIERALEHRFFLFSTLII